MVHGLRFAFGTLSVLRVRVERWDRAAAGRAMLAAPLVGLVLGALAGAVGALAAWRGAPLLAAVAASRRWPRSPGACTWTAWRTSRTGWAAASPPRTRCGS